MAYNELDISKRVCLVAGGTSGIGRAIALAYAKAGATVIVGSTNPDKVAAMKRELNVISPGHDGVQLDVADAKSVQAAVGYTAEKFGRIDAMVNAAGILKRMPSMDFPVDEFERIVKVNLTGSFIICQAVGRVMKDQTPDARGVRGAIVNIASLTSFVALEGVCAYGCSKAGVAGLTRFLANDWAVHGIRVNAIAPGIVPTEINRPLIEGTPRGDWLKKHTPWNRFGDADEIAGAAIYLISPSASFTTGQILAIDGGFLARGV